MNRSMMSIAAAALASSAASTARIFGAENIRRHLQRQKRDHTSASGSIATGNRWGGPHEHHREIARRQRQAARHG